MECCARARLDQRGGTPNKFAAMSATHSDDEKSVSEVAVAKVRNVQGTLISAPPPRCFVAKKNDDDF